MFSNWEKHLSIWTNTFGNLDKYIWQLGDICLSFRTNTFVNLEITLVNLEIYIWQFGQLGPGRPSAGGPRMDRRAVTCPPRLIQKRDRQGAPNDPDCC